MAAAVLLALPVPARAQKLPAPQPVPGVRVGDLAHDFTLKDLSDRTFSLRDLRGRKVVHVVFWATWCVPCLQEIPMLRTMYDKFRDRGLEVLGVVVNLNQTVPIVKAVARDYKVNYPILFDDDGRMMERYRVSSLPQNFLIGKDGTIRFAGNGLPRNYEALLERLLQEDGAPKTSGRPPGK